MNITCKIIKTNGQAGVVEIPALVFQMNPTQSAQYLRKRGIQTVLQIQYTPDKQAVENTLANESENQLPKPVVEDSL